MKRLKQKAKTKNIFLKGLKKKHPHGKHTQYEGNVCFWRQWPAHTHTCAISVHTEMWSHPCKYTHAHICSPRPDVVNCVYCQLQSHCLMCWTWACAYFCFVFYLHTSSHLLHSAVTMIDMNHLWIQHHFIVTFRYIDMSLHTTCYTTK